LIKGLTAPGFAAVFCASVSIVAHSGNRLPMAIVPLVKSSAKGYLLYSFIADYVTDCLNASKSGEFRICKIGIAWS
jgi:hypothetical protein